jgi:hypothetical protein
MPSAAYGYVGVGVEANPGVSVPPTKFLPVKSANFTVDQEEIMFREIAGSRQAQQSFNGSIRPSVMLTSALYPSSAFGVLMRGLFGNVTSAALMGTDGVTASQAVRHTFSDAAVLPSLSFERSDSPTMGEGILHERIPGCKVESMSFTAEFGADVEVSVDAQGLTFPEEPTGKPGAAGILLPAMDPFIFTGVGIDIDGVTSDLFKSINFDFNNTLEPQDALRRTRNSYKIHEGPLECTLSGTMIFEDRSIYTRFRDASEFTLSVEFTGGAIEQGHSYEMAFEWPRVKVQNFDVAMEAEGVMEADVEFTVRYDRSTAKFVTPTMTNRDAVGTFLT